MKSNLLIIFVTCPSAQEAKKIVQSLLKARLIACANIVRGVGSRFIWKGDLASARETLVIIKTTARNFGAVAKKIKRAHSYDVPEIVAVPVIAGDAEYLKWAAGSVR
jgi:periplasmic divalent cation tolerance protein